MQYGTMVLADDAIVQLANELALYGICQTITHDHRIEHAKGEGLLLYGF